jgi:hypothetical protein
MKLKVIFILFLIIVGMITSCNDPESDKYSKLLQSHPTKISQILPSFYSNLFKLDARKKIKLTNSLEHIGQDTVCDLLYDQKYYIALYMLSRSFDSSLQNSLHEGFGENSEELKTPFYENEINLLGISDRIRVYDGHIIKPSNIFISFGGSKVEKTEKNDTVADYNFTCKNLSIRYKSTGPQEIFVDANGDKPLEVMFLKRKRNLFLIFITYRKDFPLLNKSIGPSIFK